jgi:hypothetical protein
MRIWSILAATLGAAALVFWFAEPSMARNAWILGYSRFRILLGGCLFLAVVGVCWLAIKALRDPGWLSRTAASVDRLLLVRERLLVVITTLFVLLVLELILLVFFSSPAASYVSILRDVHTRLLPIILWLTAMAASALIALLSGYRKRTGTIGFFKAPVIYNTLLCILVLAVTIFHWLALALRMEIFQTIPGWWWQFTTKQSGIRDGLLVVIFTLPLLAFWFLTRPHTPSPASRRRGLALLLLLGYVLQIGFGFVEGAGFESIRQEHIKSGHVRYSEHACDTPDLRIAMTDYERAYGWDIFLGTKPPGVFLFYAVTQKVTQFFSPKSSLEGRLIRLTQFQAVIFPFIAALAVIPLFYISRRFLDEENAWIPALLYLTCANVLLMPLELDQVLFPLLFLLTLWVFQQAVERGSNAWALASGVTFYLAAFFSFSLLPLMGLGGVWIVLTCVVKHSERRLLHIARLLILAGMGAVLTFFLFWVALDYNFFTRYAAALARHRAHKPYDTGFRQVLDALILNNVEFAVRTGIPIFLLFVSRTFHALVSLVKRRVEKLDMLALSFGLMYAALNIVGQTRGEVGRLWIFLVPVVALLAADEVISLLKSKRLGVNLLISLQMITVALTYKFQDS